MAITRATNIAGLGTVFDALTDSGGLEITSGVSTFASDVSIADKIVHTGDTNTAIRFPAADTFTVETGGTEAFRVASDQKVYFGDFASAGSKAYIEKEVSGDYKLNIHASSSTSQNRIITINSREDVEALRITADGNIGVGTITPLSYDDTGGATRHLKIHRDGGVTRRGVLDLGAHQDTQGAFLGSIWWTNAANSSGSGTTQSRLACAIDVTSSTVSTNAGAGSGADFKILTKSEGGTLQQRLVVEAGGHVGVATTNPVYQFQVGGNIGCGIYEKQDGVLHVFNDVNNAYGRYFHDGTGLFVDSASNGTYYPLTLKTSDNQALKIETDGNFVIKSSSSYTGEQLGRFEWWNENDAGIMAKIACYREASSNAPGALTFHTSTNVDTASNSSEGEISEKMRISSDGDIGIGTDNPVERLHVAKNSATGPSIYITNDSTGHTSSDGLQIGFDGSNNVEFRNRENTQILFYTNNTEKLRVDSGGRLGIGTDSPNSGTVLDVYSQGALGTRFGYPVTLGTAGTRNLGWGKDSYQLPYIFTGRAGVSTSSTSPSDAVLMVCSPNHNPSNTRVGGILFGNVTYGSGVNSGLKSVIEGLSNVNTTNADLTGGYLRFGTRPDNGNLRYVATINSDGILNTTYQPAFRAHTTGFSKSSGWQKITFGTEDYDTNGDYDHANHKFVAPVAGRYLFYISGWSSSTDINGRYGFSANVNGGSYPYLSGAHYGEVDSPLATHFVVHNLSANDYVECYGFSVTAQTWGGATHVFYWGGYLLG